MTIKTLRIFDFDGTLAKTPSNTPEMQKIYEKHTGLPWEISKSEAERLSKKLNRVIRPRRGWWGRSESLKPPIIPDPVPESLWIQSTIMDFLKEIHDESTFTLLLTGRHVGLKYEVLRILHQGPLEKFIAKNKDHYQWIGETSACYLLGDNGPCPETVGNKPSETFPWKVWIIQQYRLIYPNIENIIIWEDRHEHVENFKKLDEQFQETVKVFHIIA